MFLRLASFGLAMVALVRVVAAEAPSFPYFAYIEADETFVRSGPGDNYYPVARVSKGERVEVFRHDPGGWYAVRPPQDAFSWVAAEFVQPTSPREGKILGNQVSVRVGSQLFDVRDCIQVRLDEGEIVEILDVQVDSATGESWCKIAPPAGEFRWVQGTQLTVNPPSFAELTTKVREMVGSKRSGRGWHAPGNRLSDSKPSTPTPSSTARASRAATARASGQKDWQAVLDEIDLELSSTVAKDPEHWQLEELSTAAETVLAKAESSTERTRARELMTRIDRFKDIRERQMAVTRLAGATAPASHDAASPDTVGGIRDGQRGLSDDQRFDATGRLTEVASRRPDMPQYALVDDSGEVRMYVTPAPGVSLNSYLGRDVGLNGMLGFMPERGTRHLTAQRVVEFNDNVARR